MHGELVQSAYILVDQQVVLEAIEVPHLKIQLEFVEQFLNASSNLREIQQGRKYALRCASGRARPAIGYKLLDLLALVIFFNHNNREHLTNIDGEILTVPIFGLQTRKT